MLIDGLGSILAASTDSPHMPTDFNKPVKIGPYLTSGSRVKFRSRTNPFAFGDHTKTTIIDGELAYIGGMNIGREYRYEWHDAMAEVSGPVVDVLWQEYRNAWEAAGFGGDWGFFLYKLFVPPIKPRAEREGDYPIRVLKTNPSDSQIYRAQMGAIRSAQRYIYIQNLYFSNALFVHDLIEARHRGVDVRLIMPVAGDNGIMNAAAILTANRLFQAGARVYLYPRMSHVKAAIYDGWACFGSANFDKLSLRINEEINLGFSEPEAVQGLLDRLFYPDFEDAVEMTEPFRTDWRNHIAELLANQL